MRVSFCDFSLEFASLDSQSELKEVLRRYAGEKDFLEEPDRDGSMFYSLRFRPELSTHEKAGRLIGLAADDTGIKPELLVAPAQGLVHVGIGFSLFVLDPKRGLINHIDLGSPFYFMILFNDSGRVLVVSELAVFCLTPMGQIIWRHDSDVIRSVECLDSHTIKVSLMENGSTNLDFITGKQLDES